MDEPDPWSLWHLVLRTPRLELRPDDDAGLLELATVARQGVHDAAEMPFSVPWTDAPAEDLGRNLLQYHWHTRSDLKPGSWAVHFLVRLDGQVIGTQGLSATSFRTTREVHTGSWLGRQYQGMGYGTEMRTAVLLFAFDHLGAEQARSDAFTDNIASRRIGDKLGYAEDGSQRYERRGQPADIVRLLLTPERFARPGWDVAVAGFPECEHLLLG